MAAAERCRDPGLRRLHHSEVRVSFAGVAPDLSGVPGVDGVDVLGPDRVRFRLSGPPGPALSVLAAADVHTVAIREPSLEEIFLGYYGQAVR
ncbi:hypothetical protein [Actinoplanes sp. NPDC051411]|uniref:hypothetical protein n=1 Tax=unclassified Actinoplanes TaxID=2626549 RepID=UPI003435B52D